MPVLTPRNSVKKSIVPVLDAKPSNQQQQHTEGK